MPNPCTGKPTVKESHLKYELIALALHSILRLVFGELKAASAIRMTNFRARRLCMIFLVIYLSLNSH